MNTTAIVVYAIATGALGLVSIYGGVAVMLDATFDDDSKRFWMAVWVSVLGLLLLFSAAGLGTLVEAVMSE